MEYFKSDHKNSFAADQGNEKCLMQLYKISECIQENMLQKYGDNIDHKQMILFNTVLHSCKENNFEKALMNFFEAIKLDKKNELLQWVKNDLNDQGIDTLLQLVETHLIPKLEKSSNYYNNLKSTVAKLKEIYNSTQSISHQFYSAQEHTFSPLKSGDAPFYSTQREYSVTNETSRLPLNHQPRSFHEDDIFYADNYECTESQIQSREELNNWSVPGNSTDDSNRGGYRIRTKQLEKKKRYHGRRKGKSKKKKLLAKNKALKQ